MIKLDNHKGLPMFFIRERIGGLDYKINFSTVDPAKIGDELELGLFIYRIDEIKEQRNSPLDYPHDGPVTFQSMTSKLVRRIEFENKRRNEIPVA